MFYKLKNYKNKFLIIIFLAAIVATKGQGITNMEDDKPYMIWTYMYAILDSGNINDLFIDTELIESLPKNTKKLVAHYSALIPSHMMDTNTDVRLASALGNFSSMEEAQGDLLKDFPDAGVFSRDRMNNKVAILYMQKNKKTISFLQYVYGYEVKKYIDEFRIEKNGNIVHLSHSENREQMDNRTKIEKEKLKASLN